MDMMTHRDLRNLAESADEFSVSMYLPMRKAGREVQQNAIRFKNAMARAHEELVKQGLSKAKAKRQIEQAAELEDNQQWWQNQSDGLAIFLGENRFQRFRVPIKFDEQIVVNSQYFLRPILPLFQDNGEFYVLAISQEKSRLFRGTHYSFQELHPDELPTDLKSALDIDHYTNTLQIHSIGGPSRRAGNHQAGAMIFHGQGAADMGEVKKNEITQYFRHVNRALESLLDSQRIPLVFAGVDFLFPIFQETSSYPGLVGEPIVGSSDRLTADQLHEKAWDVVQPIFQEERKTALKHYYDLINSDRATNDVGEIVRAARLGTLDTLFVSENQTRWGAVDETSAEVTFLEETDENADELLNDAVIHTLRTDGTVYSMPQNDFPDATSVAAILRSPVLR